MSKSAKYTALLLPLILLAGMGVYLFVSPGWGPGVVNGEVDVEQAPRGEEPLPGSQKYDWPQFRGQQRDGISKETDWEPRSIVGNPRILFKENVGIGVSGIVTANGRLYTMGNLKVDGKDHDQVICLDAKKGNKLWRETYPCSLAKRSFEGGPATTPTVVDDKVYTLSHEGHLFCWNAKTGTRIWEKHLVKDFQAVKPQWGFSSSPLVEDGVVYVIGGGKQAATIALDADTGKLKWKVGGDIAYAGYSSPLLATLDGKPTLLCLWGGEGNRGEGGVLVGLNPEDGSKLWSYPWITSYGVNASMPVITGKNSLLISTAYGTGVAHITIEDGKVDTGWSNKNLRNKFSSNVLHEGYVFGFDEKNLVCLDISNGEAKWRERGMGWGAVILVDDKLVITSETGGQLIIAETNTQAFKPIAKATLLSDRVRSWVPPTLSNGIIYVRNNDGDLVAVDVAKRD